MPEQTYNDKSNDQKAPKNNFTLTEVITTAIKMPGIKVNRDTFLKEQFKDVSKEKMEKIIDVGPVKAGAGRRILKKMANNLINTRTAVSTTASFAAGLPGGLAMVAAIPADVIQFYAVALRLAQELSYLYGEPDLWEGNAPDSEKVTNQLILYCGVMLGASGASQTVRVLSSQLAKQALKKIPQKALTKTFYYPIIKSIAKAFGAKMTKELFAKGVSKAIPIIGGVVSGGITLITIRPMGIRLANTLDSAHFDYTQQDFENDWKDIVEENEKFTEDEYDAVVIDATFSDNKSTAADSTLSAMDEISKAKELLDSNVISEKEFAEIKRKLIEKM